MPTSTAASTASPIGSARFRSRDFVTAGSFRFSLGERDDVYAEVAAQVGDRVARGQVCREEGHEMTGEHMLLARPFADVVDDERSPADHVVSRDRGAVVDREQQNTVSVGRALQVRLDAVLLAVCGRVGRVDRQKVRITVVQPGLHVPGAGAAVPIQVEQAELALRRVVRVVLVEPQHHRRAEAGRVGDDAGVVLVDGDRRDVLQHRRRADLRACVRTSRCVQRREQDARNRLRRDDVDLADTRERDCRCGDAAEVLLCVVVRRRPRSRLIEREVLGPGKGSRVGSGLHLALRPEPRAAVDDERSDADEPEDREDDEQHRLARLAAHPCGQRAHSSRSVALAVMVPVRLKKTVIVNGTAMETVYGVPTAPGVPGVQVTRAPLWSSFVHCDAETVFWIAVLAAAQGPPVAVRLTAALRAPTRAASVKTMYLWKATPHCQIARNSITMIGRTTANSTMLWPSSLQSFERVVCRVVFMWVKVGEPPPMAAEALPVFVGSLTPRSRC